MSNWLYNEQYKCNEAVRYSRLRTSFSALFVFELMEVGSESESAENLWRLDSTDELKKEGFNKLEGFNLLM